MSDDHLKQYEIILKGHQANSAAANFANLSNTLPILARLGMLMIARLVAIHNGRLLPENPVRAGVIEITSGPMPKKLPNDIDDVDLFDNFEVSQARTGLFDAEYSHHEVPRLTEASYRTAKHLR